MRNGIKCNNCGSENPLYKFNCLSCNSILRNRVVNIDLWKTAWGLIESPIATFKNIILSEHKNFVFFLSFEAGLKYLLSAILISNGFKLQAGDISDSFFINFLIATGGFVLCLILFSLLMKILGRLFGINTRFKDNYTIFVYAHLPQLLLFPLLFIIEFAVFGNYWISFNPPPYIIKPGIAFALIGLESLMVLTTVILSILAVYAQSKLKILSLITGILINVLIYGVLLILTLVIFI